MKRLLILILILLSPVTGWCVNGAPTNPHFGFYVRVGTGNVAPSIQALKNFYGGTIPSYWKGMFNIINWRDIETSEGVYDFTWLDEQYNACAAEGLYYGIRLRTQSWTENGVGKPPIPWYMQADSKYGDCKSCLWTSKTDPSVSAYPDFYGAYFEVQKGRPFPCIWDEDLLLKLDAVISAIGSHFNGKPYFEMITGTETSWGRPPSGCSGCTLSDEQVLAYHKRVALDSLGALPDMATFQAFNFMNDITSFMDWCVSNGVGLTFPDIFIKNDGNPNLVVYPYIKSHRNDIVSMAQIQWDNFTRAGVQPPTPENLLNWAIEKVDPWYILIVKREPYFSGSIAEVTAAYQDQYPELTNVKSVLQAVKDFYNNGGRLDHGYTPTDPVVSVSSTDTIANEDASNSTANFILSCPDCTGESVEFTLSGSAHLTEDYTVDVTSPVTMSGTDVTITLTAVDDAVSEWTEGVTLTVVPGTGYEVGTPPAFQQITILDDDNAPVGLSIRMEKGGIEVDSSGRIIVN